MVPAGFEKEPVMGRQKDTDREFLDAEDQASHLRRLAHEADLDDMRRSTPLGVVAKGRTAEITRTLNEAVLWPRDDGPDPRSVYEALRAFDALSERDKRRVLQGWKPQSRRPRAADVLRIVAMGFPLSRVLRMVPAGGSAVGCQDFAFLDSESPVQLIVREGAKREDVRQVLRWFDDLIDREWDRLIEDDPSACYTPRVGEVWRAFDFQRCECGLLVTYENEIDRPIAFVDTSEISGFGMSTERARELAEAIAATPSLASDGGCIDLRAYGAEDSEEPTPGWLYGLYCEPVDVEQEHAERVSPAPYCRFLARRMRERDADLPRYSHPERYARPAKKNGGTPSHPTAPKPPSNGSGETSSTAAR